MKISYNWLKWYIPEIPEADKMWDVFTYHLCEVESVDKLSDGDTIFDINILPNRAHDLLSHQGIARELASLLNIKYVDPTPKYKIPESKPTHIKIDGGRARRYTVRVVRNVKVGPSPEWVSNHLASIGQRSINNIVDATNITMFDCGQPTHAFDLDKIKGRVVVRKAHNGEKMITLDNKEVVLQEDDVVIADEEGILALAGIKGGKKAEVDEGTKNILIEIGNFFPVFVRKTARRLGIFTDAAKRFENDLSPELCDFAMLELSGLLVEYGFTDFEDVVDDYCFDDLKKKRTLKFSLRKVSSILGREVDVREVFDILKRYNFEYTEEAGIFEIIVPPMRLDLEIEEDMVEEVGRIIGYDKVVTRIPKINFVPKVNETYAKVMWARNKLLSSGYSEVMTYSFTNKGEVEVLHSAGDKNFMRTNLKDGLAESIKLNQVNAPLLNTKEIKVFEIGTVFHKKHEEVHVAYGDKKSITEVLLEEFCKDSPPRPSGTPPSQGGEGIHPRLVEEGAGGGHFKMWSLFPFITRDIALWVPAEVTSEQVQKVIKHNAGDLVIKGPDLFDSFSKDDKTSYAYRMVFQSYDRTLTDREIGEVMEKITEKIKKYPDWDLR
ncbi:MAG: phenylalanine--tRNA ligase subunit beta [bacterium]|nr:phenylalanine--tRNA ligase subunit beta [bacterium]